MKQTIFYSSLRAFFIALFSLLGVGIGFAVLMVIIGLFSDEDALAVSDQFSPKIVENANGVRKKLASSAPVILKLSVEGIIGTDLLDMGGVRQQLVESREGLFKGDRVKALLLHINSPGGTVVDADGIYRAIKDYKERYQVPVFAFVDGLCASGGVYVAVAADKIFASDVSLVGSIGVLSPPFLNFAQLLEKVGVGSLTLSAGRGKDNLNPLRPWKPDEDANMREVIDGYYAKFVSLVAENRQGVSQEQLIDQIGANVFSAQEAVSLGLIDKSGLSLSEVIALLAQEIGIKDDFYQVVQLRKKQWYSNLFNERGAGLKVTHELQVPELFNSKLMHQFLYLYLP